MGLPTTLAELIATYAAPPAQGRARVLDTDAGQGYALRALADAWGAETYGVEPSANARDARLGTTRVICDYR